MVQISPKRAKKDYSQKEGVVKLLQPPRKGFLAFLNVNKPRYFLIFTLWKHWI
jgi:hypothetical protein